jgi:hypothetical protein
VTEQTRKIPMRRVAWPRASAALLALAGLCVFAAALRPFVRQAKSAAYVWQPAVPMRDKPIVMSPPVPMHAGDFSAIEVEAAAAPGRGPTELIVLWQSPGAYGFRFAREEVIFDRGMQRFRVDLTTNRYWRGRIGQIGIQWAGGDGDVDVRQLGVVRIERSERIGLAWRQLWTRVPLDNTSINYLTGPAILGHGLNFYVGLLAAAAATWYLALRSWRMGGMAAALSSHPSAKHLVAFALVAWLAVDARATLDLAHQAIDDLRKFRGARHTAALLYGDDLAACRDMIVDSVPLGAAFIVLSNDPYYPRHRLAYLLTPHRVCLAPERLAETEYVLVYDSGDVMYDPSLGLLRMADGDLIRAELVARTSEAIYLLRLVTPEEP